MKIGVKVPCPICKAELKPIFKKPSVLFASVDKVECVKCNTRFIGTFRRVNPKTVNVNLKRVN